VVARSNIGSISSKKPCKKPPVWPCRKPCSCTPKRMLLIYVNTYDSRGHTCVRGETHTQTHTHTHTHAAGTHDHTTPQHTHTTHQGPGCGQGNRALEVREKEEQSQ